MHNYEIAKYKTTQNMGVKFVFLGKNGQDSLPIKNQPKEILKGQVFQQNKQG